MDYKFYKVLKEIPDSLDKGEVLVLYCGSLFRATESCFCFPVGNIEHINEERFKELTPDKSLFKFEFFKSRVKAYEDLIITHEDALLKLKSETKNRSEELWKTCDDLIELKRLIGTE